MKMNRYKAFDSIMKTCHPAKPWGPKDFFTGVGYPTHNLEGYVKYPESLVLPSKPPPMELTTEPFCLVHKHPSGSFSNHASQLKEHEARKAAGAFSNTLSIEEYVYNQPEISME